MIQIAPEIVDAIDDMLKVGFAVFLRMSAFFALLPGFGERSIPARVKLAMAVGLTVLVAPVVPVQPIEFDFSYTLMAEIAVGVLLGLFLRLFVMAMQTAGSMAAQATSLSQLFGGSAAEPLPAIGNLLVLAALTLAVLMGLHIKVTYFFIASYDLFPFGVFPTPAIVGEMGIDRVSNAFALAFTLAAPFIILSVIYNLALGAINKAMPQLMVAFVGAPLITAGGLILLMLSAPFILKAWLRALDAFLAAPLAGQI